MILDRDYHLGIIMKLIQNKIPPKKRCIQISEPTASLNQLTQSQQRDVIIDSFQRTRNLQSNSDVHKNPYLQNTYTSFRHSTQFTPPRYSKRQKEVKKLYSILAIPFRFDGAAAKKRVSAVNELLREREQGYRYRGASKRIYASHHLGSDDIHLREQGLVGLRSILKNNILYENYSTDIHNAGHTQRHECSGNKCKCALY